MARAVTGGMCPIRGNRGDCSLDEVENHFQVWRSRLSWGDSLASNGKEDRPLIRAALNALNAGYSIKLIELHLHSWTDRSKRKGH